MQADCTLRPGEMFFFLVEILTNYLKKKDELYFFQNFFLQFITHHSHENKKRDIISVLMIKCPKIKWFASN